MACAIECHGLAGDMQKVSFQLAQRGQGVSQALAGLLIRYLTCEQRRQGLAGVSHPGDNKVAEQC
jgi:hypothetical protein